MADQAFGNQYLKLSLISTACAVALGAVGYFPTVRLAGSGGVSAMLAGIGASLAAGLLGAIPVALAIGGPANKVPIAILGATCIRFLLILPLTAALVFSGFFEKSPLVLWIAISYLALLAVDTPAAIWSLNAGRRAAE